MLEGVGHCPMDEAPERVNPLIAAFVARHRDMRARARARSSPPPAPSRPCAARRLRAGRAAARPPPLPSRPEQRARQARGRSGDRRRQTKQKTRAARRRRTSSLCPCARPGAPAPRAPAAALPVPGHAAEHDRKAGEAKVGERRRAAAAPPRPPAPPHPRPPPPLPPGRLPALFPHAQGSKSVQDALSRLLLKHAKTGRVSLHIIESKRAKRARTRGGRSFRDPCHLLDTTDRRLVLRRGDARPQTRESASKRGKGGGGAGGGPRSLPPPPSTAPLPRPPAHRRLTSRTPSLSTTLITYFEGATASRRRTSAIAFSITATASSSVRSGRHSRSKRLRAK